MAKVKVTQGEIVNGVVSVQSIQDSQQDSVGMPSRYVATVHSGVEVEVEEGYCLCFSAVQELADKGIVITNGPGRITGGPLTFTILNGGREIVTVGANVAVANVWIEKIESMEIE
jgi:dUTPase